MKVPERWRYSPRDTALLVLDPQNDFLAPGGGAFELMQPQLLQWRVVHHLRVLIRAARTLGLPLIFSRFEFGEGDYEIHNLQELSGMNRFLFDRDLFRERAWGSELYGELRLETSDILLLPHKSIDVFSSNLGDHLLHLSTDKLIIAGMCASLTVQATASTAKERGFDVTLVRDAIGSFNVASFRQSVAWTLPFVSNLLIDCEAVASLLYSPAPKSENELLGWKVHASDGGWIGTVRGFESFGEPDGLMWVEAARPREPLLSVPTGAISKVGASRIYLNVPGRVLDLTLEAWKKKSEKKAEAA